MRTYRTINRGIACEMHINKAIGATNAIAAHAYPAVRKVGCRRPLTQLAKNIAKPRAVRASSDRCLTRGGAMPPAKATATSLRDAKPGTPIFLAIHSSPPLYQ